MGEGPFSIRFLLCWYVEQDSQGKQYQAEVRTRKGEVALEAAAGIISPGDYSSCYTLFSKYILFISTSVPLPWMFPLLGIAHLLPLYPSNSTYL